MSGGRTISARHEAQQADDPELAVVPVRADSATAERAQCRLLLRVDALPAVPMCADITVSGGGAALLFCGQRRQRDHGKWEGIGRTDARSYLFECGAVVVGKIFIFYFLIKLHLDP